MWTTPVFGDDKHFFSFDPWFHLLNPFFHSPPWLCADLRKSSWCSAPANGDPNKTLILASCLLRSPTFIWPRLWFLFFTTASTIYYHRFSITSFLMFATPRRYSCSAHQHYVTPLQTWAHALNTLNLIPTGKEKLLNQMPVSENIRFLSSSFFFPFCSAAVQNREKKGPLL